MPLVSGKRICFELRLPASCRRLVPKADLAELLRKLPGEEVQDLLRLRRTGGVLDAGVNVLGIFTEDHDVDLLRVLHRRRNSFVPTNRPQADKQVQHLPQRNVQGADAAAHGRGQRPFDADVVFAERLDRIVRQPAVEFLEALLAGVDLHPGDLPVAAVGLVHGSVQHAHARAPDVATGAVTFDEWNDGIVGHDEPKVLSRDRCASCGRC